MNGAREREGWEWGLSSSGFYPPATPKAPDLAPFTGTTGQEKHEIYVFPADVSLSCRVISGLVSQASGLCYGVFLYLGTRASYQRTSSRLPHPNINEVHGVARLSHFLLYHLITLSFLPMKPTPSRRTSTCSQTHFPPLSDNLFCFGRCVCV